jgi:hypothetical protein
MLVSLRWSLLHALGLMRMSGVVFVTPPSLTALHCLHDSLALTFTSVLLAGLFGAGYLGAGFISLASIRGIWAQDGRRSLGGGAARPGVWMSLLGLSVTSVLGCCV